ncbi:hypothetical protein FDI40_gp485 [Agrobacterium phage Atu_ph07]|uniref:Uncharacterized protein n=1 Tax=Agrobacterium phage Atu_ph07 TaxID=2024264 RepID=A0A2L0V0C1_9CAUD|nr:hypothetical protein FDI40_gp485 [Agrobacterium phage Atu_ph07]AUZ95244.1 hypothetical protein [Agrobacterium phage Atu_ph07]
MSLIADLLPIILPVIAFYFSIGIAFVVVIFLAQSTKEIIDSETENNLFQEEINYGMVIISIIIVFTIAAWPYYFIKGGK